MEKATNWSSIKLKNMNKLILLITIIILQSCGLPKDIEDNQKQYDVTKSKHLDEGIYITEIKQHEYIWSGHGGILHSESCQCKYIPTKSKSEVLKEVDDIWLPNNGKDYTHDTTYLLKTIK